MEKIQANTCFDVLFLYKTQKHACLLVTLVFPARTCTPITSLWINGCMEREGTFLNGNETIIHTRTPAAANREWWPASPTSSSAVLSSLPPPPGHVCGHGSPSWRETGATFFEHCWHIRCNSNASNLTFVASE